MADSGANPGALVKRSLSVSGHRTSISLEGAFWRCLKALAASRGLSASALVAEIDAGRGEANLSSAIRVFVLEAALQYNPPAVGSGAGEAFGAGGEPAGAGLPAARI
jgi:predicted DNA-binding ribbon-helix-helix protein